MNRHFPVVAALLTSTLALSACGGDAVNASDQPRSGGTLVYATGDDEPTCLDPQKGGNVAQALLGTQFLQTLFYQNGSGEILPWLATGWKQAADGLSWSIEIRENVKFSDGTALDAEAVKANLDRIQAPQTLSNTGRLALQKIAKVEVTGPSTVRIDLHQPDGALLESLAQVWLPIESPTAFARGLDANCLKPVGTGPYMVESWTKQDSVTLVRNPFFTTPPPDAAHTGPAYLDKIVWRFVPDGTSRFAALQSGQVHVIDVVEPQNAAAVKGIPTLRTLIAARPGEPVELELNSGRAPFDDIRVRQAFFASIDVDGALRSVYLGTVQRATSLLSSATRFNVAAPPHVYDPAAAAALLDQAGWSSRDADGYRTRAGKRLSVVLPYSRFIPLETGFYEQLQATAKKTGFEVQLQPLETAKWWSVNNAWAYDAIPVYYTKNSPDVLRITYTTAALAESTPGSYHANTAHVKNADLDRLLEEAGRSSDDGRRAELYKQAQDLLGAGFYTLPIHDQQTRLAHQTKVKGLRLQPSLAMPDLYDAWIA
ncbi:ABC transporter substrate-binding protein [Dactylosporangium fulvum]|uniref:ABC transporter substrate-binding protein n=1 Tax=Dactylosporangium fulvum TaxID=53359 RepID=A0ABY5VS39_9ACTN|nr:ABC transporter substrate-binding protein [Dactylosporangium fulvum]UWP80022.1 ABC transporter substrate-binding protein [Dactylosporangium fulvum]